MIITSLLDLDFYKLTMMNVVLHNFPGAQVEYKFKCRTPNINLSLYANEIRDEIYSLEDLQFTNSDLVYLKSIKYLSSDFIDFLRIFELDPISCVKVINDPFEICIRGSWLHTILFETLILSIVNEVYFRHNPGDLNIGRDNLNYKIERVIERNNMTRDTGFKFADFGTRRRYSYAWHKEVVETLKNRLPDNFTGTSNVLFAKEYHLVPIGTFAHEFVCAMQSMVRVSESQKYAFDIWAREYRGNLGIALSDTLGFDAFLKDFDLYFSKLFDGARHDSGNAYEWCDRLIQHYKDMKIDPKTKRAVFSDGLTIKSAIDLYNIFGKSIQTFFGIGTSITNDCGIEPIQIVIKMTKCNNQDVCKISDSSGKQMCCNDDYIKYVKSVFGIKDK